MADDKTERATPKRRADARKEGQVARSMEVNSAFAMLAGFAVLLLWGPRLWQQMTDEMTSAIRQSSSAEPITFASAMDMFGHVTRVMLVATGPFMATMLVVGVVANIVQVKFKITPEALKPRFARLNPISGFKQKFSMSSIFELFKNVGKLLIVGVPAAMALWSHRVELLSLGDAEPKVAGALAVSLAISIGFKVAGIYIVVAIIDYIFQKHRFEKQLRMTKQEVKQEARQADIAPELKMAQRRRQRDQARRRMLSEVPTADVIITNPTHYAVALKYDPEHGAPQVVAKGVDLLALRIREIAEEAGVARVENRPLARELYGRVEVGHFIPAELFAAVAEVLAYVYRTNSGAANRRQDAERDRQTMQHA